MPLKPPTPCAGCGTNDAIAYLETNAGELGHAKHGRLCSACWQHWMHGRRWTGKRAHVDGLADDLRIAWEEDEALTVDGRSTTPGAPGHQGAPGGAPYSGEAQAGGPRAAGAPRGARGAARRTVRVGDLFSEQDIPVHTLSTPCTCGSTGGYNVKNGLHVEELCAGCRKVLSRRGTRKRTR